MTKNEFLDGLRIALSGEIPNEDIESNIAFYDDYIKTKSSNNESEVIEQLGDPRLIAKTIIETYQISHGPMYGHTRNERYQEADTTNNYSYNNDYSNNNTNYYNTNNDRSRRFNLNFNFTWYQKLIMIVIAVILFLVVIIVGGILIKLFFTIGIPILIVYLGFRLITKGMRK